MAEGFNINTFIQMLSQARREVASVGHAEVLDYTYNLKIAQKGS